MTALEAAIAGVKRAKPADEIANFVATIITAVLSGDLITREASDARAGALLREAVGVCKVMATRRADQFKQDAARPAFEVDAMQLTRWRAGKLQSEQLAEAILALSPDATAALDRAVKAARGGKPLVWLESHGGFYTDNYAVTEQPEGGWVVSVRPIKSPVFASAEEAKVWVMREVGQCATLF